MKIRLQKKLNGSILDIGGGGEGMIGQLYGQQVVAIDKLQEELDEAPCACKKLRMDAADLQFENASFDHVTSFFTLMYMNAAAQQQAIREAARVLKPGGTLHIWDAEIATAYPDPFCVDLDIAIGEKQIHTTYGIVKQDGQTGDGIEALCRSAGLMLRQRTAQGGLFYMEFEKADG